MLLVLFIAADARSQTLITQTTWGATGSDDAQGVATAADGSSYLVGITDSFTVDQFGTPSPRIFLVKFAADGSLVWQRIWNGTTIRGLGRAGVAVAADGSIYVTGISDQNGGDAVLVKFDPNGGLVWERIWGGTASDSGSAVATASDGSIYICGTATSFGPSSSALFVVKFDSAGTLVWQRIFDGAEGDAVAVGPDGSVHAAGTVPRDAIGDFNLLVLKITAAGDLVWQKQYAAGNVADPRGGMTVAADGSVFVAGALQAPKAGIVDIAALIIKLGADGSLLFDKQFAGKSGETAAGVAVAPNDGTVYVAGTTTSFGAGFQDAFVLHLDPTGKKLLDAVTWGGPAFETGGGVAVSGTTFVLGATTSAGPPYSLLAAAAKLSLPHGTLAAAAGTLVAAPGLAANTVFGATATTGSTTYGGNFEAALVRVAR
ncbi:MAG TPA: hypothetical protein VKD69_16965 [Vicinamibacterales bacterium]|nr:hypothetical protein [Vicinamibacterales bacterium]